MADWSDLAIGLSGGLLGAVIGAAATVKLHHDNEDRDDKGSARVTFFELAELSSYLSTAQKNKVPVPLPVSTWPQTRARLAMTLPPEDFALVATAYAKVAALDLAWKTRRRSNLRPETVGYVAEILQRVEAGADLLERKGWVTVDERNELHAQLDEHIHGP
jgi:hypothetical protein